jgi:hypothetical protein
MEVIEESEDKREKADAPPDSAASAAMAGVDSDVRDPLLGDGASGTDPSVNGSSDTAQALLVETTDQPAVEQTAEPYSPEVLTSDPALRPRDMLPPVADTADLARPARGRVKLAANLAVCFIVTFAIYVWTIPHFVLYGNPPTGDQPFYLMDVISMVQDWDLNVKNNYDNNDFDKFYNYKPDGFVGMTAPYPPGRQLADTPNRPADEQYSAHPPGLPVLLIPGWLIGDWIGGNSAWPWSLTVTCLLAALLSVNVFLLAYETTGRLWAGWAVWLPVAFSGPIMTYAYMIFTEMPVGLLMIYAFRRLALGWGANGKLRLLLIGLCIGFIPWLSLRCIPIAAILVLYAAVQWWRYSREMRITPRIRVRAPKLQAAPSSGEASSIGSMEPTPEPATVASITGRPVRAYSATVAESLADGSQENGTATVLEGASSVADSNLPGESLTADGEVPAIDAVPATADEAGAPVIVPQPEAQPKRARSAPAIVRRARGFWHEVRARVNRGTLPHTAWVIGPVILSVALLVGFQLFKSGTFVPGSSEKGRVDHFFFPWTGSEGYSHFINAFFGTFFDSRFGLLTYTPVYLLAAVGLIAMFRTGRGSDRRLLFWIGLLAVPYMAFIFTYEGWHGVWNPPARYVSTFVGLMAAPFAMALFVMTRNWITGIIYSAVYAFLSWPGIVTAVSMIHDARVMWPLSLSPTYDWLAQPKAPFFAEWVPAFVYTPFTFDIREWLVNFLKPDEVAHPMATARVIVAALMVVFVLFLLMYIPRIMRTGRHWPIQNHGVAWLGVFGLLALGWYGMNDNYLKHKTVVTLQQKWLLPAHLDEPYGIAYLDGKVYVTSFNRADKGFVAVLNLNATEGQNFSVISPTIGGSPAQFAHPSDIKVGPGGLLYVLNNGDGIDSLWVMTPGGEVVRRLVLNGKTPISTGMNIGPDGSYFVADMLGGRIDVWNKDGNDATVSYGGPTGGFNNPSGVAISEAGHVFAIENGNSLVHEIARDGTVLRRYNPECRPVHGTTNGEWIDISCENGLVSINTKSNYLQFSRFAPAEETKPETMRGLAYGPDSTLFMLDSNTNSLYKYKVEH